MKNLTLLCFVCAALGALALPAGAEQYWYTYEGNDLPENEGWTRNINAAGGANRWIEDGALVIDSLDNAAIWDNYEIDGILDPGPGECFIGEWRLFSEEALFWYDAGVTIARTFQPGYILILYRVDDLLLKDDAGWMHIPIAPDEWHVYHIESEDMVSYTLSIDDVEVHTGVFEDETYIQSVVGWGDKANGAASLTKWDYVHFGVVPEPHSLTSYMLAVLSLRAARRSF